MSRFRFLTVVMFALATAGCENDPPTLITPTPIPTVTDTFTGAVTQSGAASWSFTVTRSGNVQATLSSLLPEPTLIVGFALGTWNGASCQLIIANDKATQGSLILGLASSAGSLCVRIYDVGNVTDPADYQIDVVHY